MRIAWQIAYSPSRCRIWAFVAALLALLIMTSSTFAAGQLTGTFVGLDPLRHQFVRFTRPDGRVVNDQAGVIQLRLDKNVKGDRQGPLLSVFCIQLFVSVGTHPFPTETYFSNGSVNALPRGSYIRYLLAHYPASTVAPNDTAEAAARQLAIWRFSDTLDLTTIQDANIRARAIALANEAQTWIDLNGPLPTVADAATITISPPSATVPQGQPATYTVSVSPPNAAPTVNVSVDGTAILDNGLQQATLTLNQGTATFNVTNPNVGIANIIAVLPYMLDAGTVFDSTRNPPTQQLVLGDGISLSATAQVQTTWQPVGATATPTNTPVVPTNTPGVSTDTPVAATNTPGSPTNTPGGPTNTPSSPTNTPVNTPKPKTPNSAPDRTATPTRTHVPGTNTSETPQSNQPSAPGSPGDTTEVPAPTSGSPNEATAVTSNDSQAISDSNVQGQAPTNSIRPGSLPRTGADGGGARQAIVLVGLVLLVSGLIARRRGARQ